MATPYPGTIQLNEREEVIQRLMELLEQNSRVEVIQDRFEGTIVTTNDFQFTVPRATPAQVHRSISRTR